MKETIRCLYCHTENSIEKSQSNASDEQTNSCIHCGMALPDKHPEASSTRSSRFVWWFVFIVVFCVIMMIYLPR